MRALLSVLLSVLLLAAGMAAATVLVGWWGVPLLAAIATLLAAVRRGSRVARLTPRLTPAGAAVAGALAWGGLLAVDAAGARFGAVFAIVGGVMPVPALVVAALTLLLPALLAWSAAALAEGLVGFARTGPSAAVTLPAPGPSARGQAGVTGRTPAGPTAAATP